MICVTSDCQDRRDNNSLGAFLSLGLRINIRDHPEIFLLNLLLYKYFVAEVRRQTPISMQVNTKVSKPIWIPSKTEFTTPSHSQSLVNFAANIHSRGMSAAITNFAISFAKPFEFATESLRNASFAALLRLPQPLYPEHSQAIRRLVANIC